MQTNRGSVGANMIDDVSGGNAKSDNTAVEMHCGAGCGRFEEALWGVPAESRVQDHV